MSGPLLDRIDLHVEVPPVPYQDLARAGLAEPSAAVRARVAEARRREGRNPGGAPNARATSAAARELCRLDDEGRSLMERAVSALGLSTRAHDRSLRVARTIADLAGSDRIRRDDLAEAIKYSGMGRPFSFMG